jgi:hypothetical protein
MGENGVPERLAEFFWLVVGPFLTALARAIRQGKMHLG